MITHKLFISLPFLHPLCYITVAFILGICFGANTCNVAYCCFFALCLFLTAYITTYSYANFYMLAASICISFLAGKYNFYHQQQNFYDWASSLKEPVDIIVTITDITPSSTKNYKFIVTTRIEKLYSTDYSCAKTWQTTPYYLLIYTKKLPKALVQDRIFISSSKITCSSKKSWNHYALKYNIGGTIFCKQLNYNLISRPYWSWKRWLWNTRQKFSERLFKKMSNDTVLFYALLFMGTHHKSKEDNKSLRDTFQTWGILHYLARSGLHLVVFLMIWNILLLLIPCSYKIREGFLLLLCSVYFILSWPSLSFVRAFTTCILYKITSLYSRSSNTLHILTLVTLFFLIFNPIYLFCLDFQLSFGLTFALGWFQSNNATWKNIQMNS